MNRACAEKFAKKSSGSAPTEMTILMQPTPPIWRRVHNETMCPGFLTGFSSNDERIHVVALFCALLLAIPGSARASCKVDNSNHIAVVTMLSSSVTCAPLTASSSVQVGDVGGDVTILLINETGRDFAVKSTYPFCASQFGACPPLYNTFRSDGYPTTAPPTSFSAPLSDVVIRTGVDECLFNVPLSSFTETTGIARGTWLEYRKVLHNGDSCSITAALRPRSAGPVKGNLYITIGDGNLNLDVGGSTLNGGDQPGGPFNNVKALIPMSGTATAFHRISTLYPSSSEGACSFRSRYSCTVVNDAWVANSTVVGPYKTTSSAQAAITSAACGTTILFAHGVTFRGITYMHRCPGSRPIQIISDNLDPYTGVPRDASLPRQGNRVTAANTAGMAKIVADGAGGTAIKLGDNTSGLRLAGLEVTVACPLTNSGTLISITNSSNTLSSVPDHVFLDRIYVHDCGTQFYSATGFGYQGIVQNGTFMVVRDSLIGPLQNSPGTEYQAWNQTSGNGPTELINDEFVSNGENVLFGGGGPMPVGLANSPANVLMRGNYIHRPVDWVSLCLPTAEGSGMPSQCQGIKWSGDYSPVAPAQWRAEWHSKIAYSAGDVVWYGHSSSKYVALASSSDIRPPSDANKWHKGTGNSKNLCEFKEGSQVLIVGNILEYASADAQTTTGLLLETANQNGSDITASNRHFSITENVIRHTNAPYILVGPQGGYAYPAADTRNVDFFNNLAYDVGGPPWNEDGTDAITMINAYGGWDLRLQHNTLMWQRPDFASDIVAYDTPRPKDWHSKWVMEAWIFADNVFDVGKYGFLIAGAQGNDYAATDPMSKAFDGHPWNRNVLTSFGYDRNGDNRQFYVAPTFVQSGGTLPRRDTVRFVNPEDLMNASSWALQSSSPYHNAASDRTDMGAQVNFIVQNTSCVISGQCATAQQGGVATPHAVSRK